MDLVTDTYQPIRLKVDYFSTFQFERDFDLDLWRKWFERNWSITIHVSWAYIFLIFTVQKFMRGRKPFQLKIPLAIWNLLLAAFSVIVFFRTAPEMMDILLSKNGLHNSVCHWAEHNPATAFWSFLMLLSKMVELGDTLFVVLRKQNLIFLHWYHHVTTLISWWLMYSLYEPNQLWYIVMNSYVHSIMYFYYFLKTIKVNVTRRWSMLLTSIQLAQMMGGISVNLYAFYVMVIKGTPKECDRGYFGLKVSFWMYSTFFLLFAKFFFDIYIVTPPKKSLIKFKEEADPKLD